jgi:hypothetical protein
VLAAETAYRSYTVQRIAVQRWLVLDFSCAAAVIMALPCQRHRGARDDLPRTFSYCAAVAARLNCALVQVLAAPGNEGLPADVSEVEDEP